MNLSEETVAVEPVGVVAAKPTSNNKLHRARKAKNDEFYTRLEDVEAELYHYREHFRDKTVYLNCDDPRWSAFWRYFALSFQHLGLKRLIATHYTGVLEGGVPSYGLEILRGRDEDVDGRIGVDSGVRFDLEGDGDFRSEECVELLKQSDIVVTNPPFSNARDYVAQLVEHDKRFLFLGNPNMLTYKEVWPLIQDGKLWLGVTANGGERWFSIPEDHPGSNNMRIAADGSRMAGVAVRWFTNLDHSRRHEEIPLYMKYAGNEDHYPCYDNYDAINVDKVKEIPEDYDGVMGVPITFLGKWNPDQFEILGISEQNVAGGSAGRWDSTSGVKHPLIAGKRSYARILIKAVR